MQLNNIKRKGNRHKTNITPYFISQLTETKFKIWRILPLRNCGMDFFKPLSNRGCLSERVRLKEKIRYSIRRRMMHEVASVLIPDVIT